MRFSHAIGLRFIREGLPALVAMGYLWVTAEIFQLPDTLPLLGMAAAGALCVYGADHAMGTRRQPPRKTVAGIALPFLLAYAFLWLLIRPRLNHWMAGSYILLALGYVFPVFPGGRRVQDLPVIRVAVILMGWTLLPFLSPGFSISMPEAGFLTGTAFYLLPNILWSDMADREADQEAGRVTLAHRLNPDRVRILCLSSFVLSAAIFLWGGHGIMVPGPLLFLIAQEVLPWRKTAQAADLLLLWPWVAVCLIGLTG